MDRPHVCDCACGLVCRCVKANFIKTKILKSCLPALLSESQVPSQKGRILECQRNLEKKAWRAEMREKMSRAEQNLSLGKWTLCLQVCETFVFYRQVQNPLHTNEQRFSTLSCTFIEYNENF